MTKFLNISTDNTLGGVSPSDVVLSSQKAIKEYVDNATSGSGVNVGDIFLTMRNDNELNGAVECDGSTYNTTDFTGAQSIGNLLANGKVPYVSMAVYASTVAAQGWCDKFGWDGTGNVQFKVPTLSAYIWQKLQTSVVGNGKAMILTDGTKSMGFGQGSQTQLRGYETIVAGTNVGTTGNGNGYSTGKALGLATSGDTGIIAGSASDISQQRCMVQLATSATDEALETCTSVLADVATLKGYDYVVAFQRPTVLNNFTWYRKYKSGWVEQGGIKRNVTSTYDSVTLPIEMSNINYTLISSLCEPHSGGQYSQAYQTSTTTFNVKYSGTGTTGVSWQVSGMAAS